MMNRLALRNGSRSADGGLDVAGMEMSIGWGEAAWRLVGAAVAGILIGVNRGERGKPAGLRTTLLVCLAAALSMVLMDAMMGRRGKTSDSFVVIDLMRLPLGILSGIGFIGAGTILRKGDFVVGVTTAATIWFVTVVGLCFGAGYMGLGWAGTGMGLAVLWGLGWLENGMKREHHAVLEVVAEGKEGEVLTEAEVRRIVEGESYHVVACGLDQERLGETRRHRFSVEVQWRARRWQTASPAFLRNLASRTGVVKVGWRREV